MKRQLKDEPAAGGGSLRLELLDTGGEPLRERVDVFLYHQTLRETVAAREVMAAGPIEITGLRAAPQGLYRVEIDPPSYLPVSFFINLGANGPTSKSICFPVDPRKVLRVNFPPWSEIPFAQALLKASSRVLGLAGRKGRELYEAFDDVSRAGLMNILSKCRVTPLPAGGVVLDRLVEIREVRGDRFFAVVSQELREQVKGGVISGLFHPASGALHRPPDGFTHAGSFKTDDPYGNLQLTFFAKQDEWVADIDIDDAAGLGHIFQVLRNHLTGRPTHPYDIREILLRYQEIDPGYRFILREADSAVVAG